MQRQEKPHPAVKGIKQFQQEERENVDTEYRVNIVFLQFGADLPANCQVILNLRLMMTLLTPASISGNSSLSSLSRITSGLAARPVEMADQADKEFFGAAHNEAVDHKATLVRT